MQVFVAKNRGFCEGVGRAVNTALSIPAENTYVLGELIHNKDVVKRLTDRGIIKADELSEVPDGATLIIRSHGVGKAVYEESTKRNIKVVDCTCAFVHRTQQIVEKASAEGKTVVIAGRPTHPEVLGLVGWCCGETYVFSSEKEDFSVLAGKNVVLVSQTTFSEQRFSKISQNIQKVCLKTVEIFKTICYTTISRQRETERLSKICDAVVIIGGKNSSNTGKLCEIASANCGHVLWLESADDFKYEKIYFCSRVGVIAGASTPDWQTQEVLFKMAENKAEVQTAEPATMEEAVPVETETVEAPVAEPVAEETAPVAESAESPASEEAAPVAEPTEEVAEPAAEAPAEPVMAKVLAGIDRESRYRKNQILSVTVVSATDEGVYVSVSGKGEILIEKAELDCEQYSKEVYAAKVGQPIDVMVTETAPKVKLSEKAMRKIREEEALLKDIEDGKMFTVTCTGSNKGGLTAELGTYPVFVPAREIRNGFVKDLTQYTGKKLRLRLIEIRRGRRKEIIASQRVILEEERAAQDAARAAKEEAFFDSIEVDQIVEGKVERITAFGAFVSVRGFDCLAHISDLSWTGVKKVEDVLEKGKRYEFKVLKVDRENKRVSIGYKQLQPEPWELAAEKYAVGDIIHGKVVRIVPFGAFVEIEKGIDGLVHVSQISYEWLDNPTSVLKIGEEIDAKILDLKPAEHRITLSIKALQDRPEPEYPEEAEESPRQPRQKRGSRRNSHYDYDEDAEYREWNDGGYDGGVSIAEMLGGTNEDPDDGDKK